MWVCIKGNEADDAVAELLETAQLSGTAVPRLVWGGRETADHLAAAGLEIDRCWDVQVVHRLLFGGWKAPLGELWATLKSLPLDTLPRLLV